MDAGTDAPLRADAAGLPAAAATGAAAVEAAAAAAPAAAPVAPRLRVASNGWETSERWEVMGPGAVPFGPRKKNSMRNFSSFFMLSLKNRVWAMVNCTCPVNLLCFFALILETSATCEALCGAGTTTRPV